VSVSELRVFLGEDREEGKTGGRREKKKEARNENGLSDRYIHTVQ
jgi:hypothetical protein